MIRAAPREDKDRFPVREGISVRMIMELNLSVLVNRSPFVNPHLLSPPLMAVEEYQNEEEESALVT